MNKLSVIIITNRADERFQAAVKSSLFADEVLVVTFGEVKMPALEKSVVKVIHGGPKITDFGEARNQALTQALGNWVLFLDSDEVITPESVAEIQAIVQNDGLAGVYVQRRDIFYGQELKWGETGQAWFLRLAQKNKLQFERPVHEVAGVDGVRIQSSIRLLHYPHPTINEFWNSIAQYSQLEAQYRVDQGQKFSLLQLLFYPVGKFCLNFLIRLGILDGWRGLVYALMMTLHSLMVRVFVYEKTRN